MWGILSNNPLKPKVILQLHENTPFGFCNRFWMWTPNYKEVPRSSFGYASRQTSKFMMYWSSKPLYNNPFVHNMLKNRFWRFMYPYSPLEIESSRFCPKWSFQTAMKNRVRMCYWWNSNTFPRSISVQTGCDAVGYTHTIRVYAGKNAVKHYKKIEELVMHSVLLAE